MGMELGRSRRNEKVYDQAQLLRQRLISEYGLEQMDTDNLNVVFLPGNDQAVVDLEDHSILAMQQG